MRIPAQPRILLAAAAAALAVACGSVGQHARQGGAAGGGPTSGQAGSNAVATVVTRNLYLGAELGPAMAARSDAEFLRATTAVWAMVRRNDFRVRVRAIANEIAAARADLVGLQEAYLWELRPAGEGAFEPAYDYVDLLLSALAARGLRYRVAASVTLFSFAAPIRTGETVRMTDHGVILAREDVRTAHATGRVFTNLLPVNVLGHRIPVKRGFVSVEVEREGVRFEFASVHLEAYQQSIRTLQAQELAGALDDRLPVILVGDLNSNPGTSGAAVLARAGLRDVWATLHPEQPGPTSPWPDDLSIAARPWLRDRIDAVLVRGPLTPVAATIVGTHASDRIGGLWPSDHAGVVATIRLDATDR